MQLPAAPARQVALPHLWLTPRGSIPLPQGAANKPTALPLVTAPQDRKLLLRSTLVTKAGCDWADGDDVRGLDVKARIFSADGPNVVDASHDFHHRVG